MISGLGQQRQMPAGLYAQEKTCKQEEKLLAKLQALDMTPRMYSVFCRQCEQMLDGRLTEQTFVALEIFVTIY